MSIRSTKPASSVIQNARNTEALVDGGSVVLDAVADADTEAEAVLSSYSDMTPDQQQRFRSAIENSDYRVDNLDKSEFVTATMGALSGAGLAALAGRTDVFSLVGGAALGFATGWGAHKAAPTLLGAAPKVWEKMEGLEKFEIKTGKDGLGISAQFKVGA
ncbi:hypothetical protein [Roseibium sp. MMSF_3544]|uniref:hypothetical protein n=1 Tax=unclassified Roseibium TaxID=2629323 RepID=UPI00273E381D|nr:hypothetical protein [Roseibium sp. MMSF_3544]